MAKLNRFYKCEICGNVISVVESGEGTLVCCGQNMTLLEEKTNEAEGKEKHVPVIEIKEDSVIVRVGEVEHPMVDEHYISLVQLIDNDHVIMGKRLKPGQKPVVEFKVNPKDLGKFGARILCNVHGVYRT